jgi:hypothetical protein
MANAYGTPLGLNAVYSIASAFITSCPSTNAALPVMAYAALTVTQGVPVAPGIDLTFTVAGDLPATFFVTFVSGLDILPAAATVTDGTITTTVPAGISGQAYAFITSDDSANLTDSTILFGPAIIEATPDSPTFDLTVTK